MSDLTAIEERLAHLERLSEDLSDVIARQDSEIAALRRKVELLIRREAEREGSGPEQGDPNRPPPHW